MIKGSHIHFHHGGNSDVGRTARDSPLGVQSDYESNMCCCTIHICACSGWGLLRSEGGDSIYPTLATEALTTARLKLVTPASACQPSSDFPWPPINQYLGLFQLEQSAVRQHVLHTEKSTAGWHLHDTAYSHAVAF